LQGQGPPALDALPSSLGRAREADGIARFRPPREAVDRLSKHIIAHRPARAGGSVFPHHSAKSASNRGICLDMWQTGSALWTFSASSMRLEHRSPVLTCLSHCNKRTHLGVNASGRIAPGNVRNSRLRRSPVVGVFFRSHPHVVFCARDPAEADGKEAGFLLTRRRGPSGVEPAQGRAGDREVHRSERRKDHRRPGTGDRTNRALILDLSDLPLPLSGDEP
jgi:hypothetical protein